MPISRSPVEAIVVQVHQEDAHGGLVTVPPCPPVGALAGSEVVYAYTVALAHTRTRPHATIILIVHEASVASALIRRHARPIPAIVLAKRHADSFVHRDEAVQALATVRLHAGGVLAGRIAKWHATVCRVVHAALVARANVGRSAGTVSTTVDLAGRFADIRVVGRCTVARVAAARVWPDAFTVDAAAVADWLAG